MIYDIWNLFADVQNPHELRIHLGMVGFSEQILPNFSLRFSLQPAKLVQTAGLDNDCEFRLANMR